jgi:hypothetical protein
MALVLAGCAETMQTAAPGGGKTVLRIASPFKAGHILVDLQRKGMQVIIPDAETFRVKAKAAVEALFQKDWNVTTWQEVLAY